MHTFEKFHSCDFCHEVDKILNKNFSYTGLQAKTNIIIANQLTNHVFDESIFNTFKPLSCYPHAFPLLLFQQRPFQDFLPQPTPQV